MATDAEIFEFSSRFLSRAPPSHAADHRLVVFVVLFLAQCRKPPPPDLALLLGEYVLRMAITPDLGDQDTVQRVKAYFNANLPPDSVLNEAQALLAVAVGSNGAAQRRATQFLGNKPGNNKPLGGQGPRKGIAAGPMARFQTNAAQTTGTPSKPDPKARSRNKEPSNRR